MAALEGAAMCTGSIPHTGYDNEVRRLDFVHRLRYFDFVMYYIYGQSGP